MRVCEPALSGRDCAYGHLWAAGTPFAIHSHPRQGTALVRDGRSLDRVLRSWPGYVEFEQGARDELRHVVVDIAGDPSLQDLSLPDMAHAAPEALAAAMFYARAHLEGEPTGWLSAEPSWDDVLAGGTGTRCRSESAAHRCELSLDHPRRHLAHGRARSGRIIYTYAW